MERMARPIAGNQHTLRSAIAELAKAYTQAMTGKDKINHSDGEYWPVRDAWLAICTAAFEQTE